MLTLESGRGGVKVREENEGVKNEGENETKERSENVFFGGNSRGGGGFKKRRRRRRFNGEEERIL